MPRLSIVEYMRYLGGTESSRCVHEGEELVNAGHIITLGRICTADTKHVKLCALCLQTSALKSAPHHINGMLHIEGRGNVKVVKMDCTCKAGNSGKCKHVSAVLIRCTRENIDDLDVMSQTDLKCVWSTQKNFTQEKYKAVSIDEMPCLKAKIVEPELNVDEQTMGEFFMRKICDSAITKHSVGRRDLGSSPSSSTVESNEKEIWTNILNHACQSTIMMELASIETANRNECCKILYNRLFDKDISDNAIFQSQHSNEWKANRKYRVTGSRVYELFTYSKQEWKSKSLQYFFPKGFTNKFVKHGLKYESNARDAFMEKTGLMVIECGMVISHCNEWLGFSPDGIIVTQLKPVALLEIKCLYEGATSTIMEAMSNAKYLYKLNGKYYLKEKHKYHGQIQLGMALLNLDSCYLALFASFDKNEEDSTFDIEESKKLEIEAIHLAENGNYTEALNLINKALQITPQRPPLYNNRAHIHQYLRKFEDAFEDVTNAINLSTNKYKRTLCLAYCQRGILHRRAENIESAKADFETAAKMGNDFAKGQLVELNPYAALCNQMLRQVMDTWK